MDPFRLTLFLLVLLLPLNIVLWYVAGHPFVSVAWAVTMAASLKLLRS